ncbi:SDR family NAD(P)-dependent oxidoreductase [Ferrovibrio sp.]|uniref:SDR family NAD(P)-dependent oxidoreductase n=1 Tax=Ferrovibrio sp. TaxID=1917215 RepID=UPI003D0A5AA1
MNAMPGVVWITGAGSGLGRALAQRYLAAGGAVAGTSRRTETLSNLALAAAGQPGCFHVQAGDLTKAGCADTLVDAIERTAGPIRLAVLNAGTHIPDSAEQFSAATVASLLETNVMSVAYCLEALLPRMLSRGQGQIAINASLAGYRGLPRAAAYGASKAALINMAESLRIELEPRGVTMRLINPGFVRTPLTDRNDFPMPFLMEVETAAEQLYQALEHGSAFEIVFPRRFACILKVLRLLPYALYLPLMRKLIR